MCFDFLCGVWSGGGGGETWGGNVGGKRGGYSWSELLRYSPVSPSTPPLAPIRQFYALSASAPIGV
jgi:hypothetical protein